MKVFYIVSNAFRITGGAELAALTALQHLRDGYGFDCELLSGHPCPKEEVCKGIRLRAFRDVDELKGHITDERPDVLIGSLADAVPAFRIGRLLAIPRILSVHGYEFSPPSAGEAEAWRIAPGQQQLGGADIDFVLDSANHIFCCSEFIRQFLKERAQKDSEVLLNAWDLSDVLVDDACRGAARYITGVCGYRNKGADIFVELARRFPKERFRLAGDPYSDIALVYLREAAGCPNIEICGRLLPHEFLADSKLVLVPSQWPEPYGRIAVEALANEVPVLASRTGGLPEIIGNESPMGIDDFRNICAWEECLRSQLAGHRISAADLKSAARHAKAILAAQPIHRLAEVIQSLATVSTPDWDTRSVSFVGAITGAESHSKVNAAWAAELASRGYSISQDGEEPHLIPDAVIAHDYSKNFNDLKPPASGHYIAVRTSDFGPHPTSWVDKIEKEFDQLWAYTNWIAKQALSGGIAPDKIRIVPLGVDPDTFTPKGPPSKLLPRDVFSFLFVGGAVRRKGIDILVKAYRSAFTSADNVVLVIKGDSSNMFYTNRGDVENSLEGVVDPDAPRVLHVDRHLSDAELAALYRGCDVGVFPYRAEGFVLPIAEAMACGTPSIVPDFGPCLDFCSDETSFLVPVRRICLPYSKTVNLALGFEMDVESVDFCEVKADALAHAMRQVFEAGRPSLKEKKLAGLDVARKRLNWRTSADHIEARLQELNGTVPRRIAARRNAAATAYRLEAAARAMAVDAIVGLSRREAGSGVSGLARESE